MSKNLIVTSTPISPRDKNGFAIGDIVVASGNYWQSSDGKIIKGVVSNLVGKIIYIEINKNMLCRYKIMSLDGNILGYFADNELSHKKW